eukprot:3189239-Rhodomonas_salina.4
MLLRIRLRACAMSGTDVVYGTTFFSFSARCTAGEPYCDSGVHAGRPCPVIGATCAVLSPYAPTTQCPVLTYSTVLCDIQYHPRYHPTSLLLDPRYHPTPVPMEYKGIVAATPYHSNARPLIGSAPAASAWGRLTANHALRRRYWYPAIGLRARYAKSGTELGYAATRH